MVGNVLKDFAITKCKLKMFLYLLFLKRKKMMYFQKYVERVIT